MFGQLIFLGNDNNIFEEFYMIENEIVSILFNLNLDLACPSKWDVVWQSSKYVCRGRK